MNIKIFVYASSITLWWLCLAGFADPLPTPTALPFPRGATEAEREMVTHISMLQVYPDSEDSDKYYYIPPFHVRQYAEGAAHMFLNSLQLNHFVNAQAAIDRRDNYSAERITKLQQDIVRLSQEVARTDDIIIQAQNNLAEAVRLGNQGFIDSAQAYLRSLQERHDRLSNELHNAKTVVEQGQVPIPDILRREFNQQAMSSIGFGGVYVFTHTDAPLADMELAIKEGMGRLGNSNGGYLIANIYAGFTESQLKAIKDYKNKYFPNIKIVLMPTEKMNFFPLFEIKTENNYGKYADGIEMSLFQNIKGSGDYLGATIVMHTSVAGGMALASHLGPFVLPLGIEAQLKFNAETIDVELECDFSKDFNIPGRDTLRKDVFIYDTPDRLLLLNKYSNSMCHINIHEGRAESIEYWLIKTIDKAMLDAGAKRIELNVHERKAYGEMMQKAFNRPYIQPRFFRLDKPDEYFSWYPFHSEGVFGYVPEYHYAVDAHQVPSFSKLKIKKHIYVRGHEPITKHLATNLCLVYNPQKQAYERCTPVEVQSSQTMAQAAHDAQHSYPCQANDSSFACGKKRDELLEQPRHPRHFENDTSVLPAL